jgi:hypothetical protein
MVLGGHRSTGTTLSVCIALLCLSQSESLSQLVQLKLENTTCQPDPAMSNSAVTFHNFVCSGCYQRGPGSRSSPYFCSYKAVSTHIGCSTVCQTGGKGFYTVPVQYRPSCRAEDQEAGPVGAGGAWPVRPKAPAAAPGKHWQWRIAYRMLQYCVRRRSTISYVSGDVNQQHRNLTYDIV